MSRTRKRPEKAYKNLDFLTSQAARPIRILSELLEPLSRFQRHNVRDTIVFFGSARILPLTQARKRLRSALRKTESRKTAPASLRAELEAAERAVDLARYYEDAAELARLITCWSHSLGDGHRFIVCSGGGPGIMEAANRGASMAGGPSMGLNISLPFEQFPNPYITDELSFEFHYFFMRKFWFSYLAKGMVVFPGGFGTVDELIELLTLVQTQKIDKPLPIVVYGPNYWNEVLNFKALVRWGMISPEDLSLFRFADSPEEAFAFLKRELERSYLGRKRGGIKGLAPSTLGWSEMDRQGSR